VYSLTTRLATTGTLRRQTKMFTPSFSSSQLHVTADSVCENTLYSCTLGQYVRQTKDLGTMSPLGHRGESSRHSSITKWTPFRRSYSSLNRALVSSVLLLFIGMAYGADVLTAKNDNARTGQNLEEIILNTKNVNVQQFGKLYTFPVDGYVYAQPLYKSHLPIPGFGIRDVLFVATAHDSVYAFDALGNNPASGFLWSVSFLDSSKGITTVPAGDVSTNDIVPEIGITGSPVIDSATNTLYVVSKTKQSSNGTARWIQQLHALDLATGAEKMNGPIEIQASLPGWGAGSSNNILTFDPRIENQRAALVLVNNGVYVAWAAHGDQGSYHGWIIGYSAAIGRLDNHTKRSGWRHLDERRRAFIRHLRKSLLRVGKRKLSASL
jgi:hypothetical protein